ncbi:MAG: glycosylase [Lachnospiraceae bacterium]|nr:glycosylase [Lachnospiraceae bacterium]
MPSWLKDAVFYEIYPQSFRDTNGDGIGDIPGIEEKLDYIKELGCNALWINPCYDSPFHDAGYDVRDYKKVAPRYGTNDDLVRLFREAHARGIRVLLDLVPGHTSEEHPWFLESKKLAPNEYTKRYIWTDHWLAATPGHPYIAGECERPACYMLNFFKCQPALNYGFKDPIYPWQSATDSPEARATIEAVKDVMRFWLGKGCDGFRVDMADSLVKDDDEVKSGTCAIWREIRQMLDAEYPEAAIISEWSNPVLALNSAGFHMDFYLDHRGNGYNTLFRDYENYPQEGMLSDHSFFRADGSLTDPNGRSDVLRFLDDYLPKLAATRGRGYISFISCNHDTRRPRYTLSDRELQVAYLCLYTMPGVPFVYYGDEIGMRYQELPTKEGGYDRTGSRTPMQWNSGKNLGFSDAEPSELYLPVDPAPDAPTAEKAMADEGSLYHTVKKVLQLRHAHPALQADGELEILYAQREQFPFVYARIGEGERLTIAVNPSLMSTTIYLPVKLAEPLYVIGEVTAVVEGEGVLLTMGPQSAAIF